MTFKHKLPRKMRQRQYQQTITWWADLIESPSTERRRNCIQKQYLQVAKQGHIQQWTRRNRAAVTNAIVFSHIFSCSRRRHVRMVSIAFQLFECAAACTAHGFKKVTIWTWRDWIAGVTFILQLTPLHLQEIHVRKRHFRMVAYDIISFKLQCNWGGCTFVLIPPPLPVNTHDCSLWCLLRLCAS